MTIQDLIQCLIVNGSLALLLLCPFLAAARILTRNKPWQETVLLAMVLGCSVQAAMGLLWTHLLRGHPGSEPFVYFLFCVVLSLFLFVFRGDRAGWKKNDGCRSSHAVLLLILMAAFVVRSIHPLQTFALGQSDAYTHLHYLNYIVQQGFLANGVYPSGYHWILALPVLLLHLDPYTVARFGGAFLGTGMVLGVYVFLNRLFERRAAIVGSLFAACFPGMMLLMKTGVGTFANQFGIFLIPCLLYGYTSAIGKEKNGEGRALLLAASLGIAASVPMMFIHILIIFSVERFFALFQNREQWLRQTSKGLGLCLPAILLIIFHFSQAGAGQRFQTAQILTDYGERDKVVTAAIISKVDAAGSRFSDTGKRIVQQITRSPYFTLLVDFFSMKRVGYGNVKMDGMALCLLAMFVFCIGLGIYRQNTGLLILGIWGGLTSVQAATGFLQFSSYQREGWSLLVAVCCLVGVAGSFILQDVWKYFFMQAVLLLFACFCFFWSVVHPPAHPALQSSAEDLLIRTVRYLDSCHGKQPPEFHELCSLLDPALPVILVSRKFVGWSNQGELIPNVLPAGSNMQTLLVNGRQGADSLQFDANNQYVVLLDKEQKQNAAELFSAFAMVSPELVKGVLLQQKFMYRANGFILSYLKTLDTKRWKVREVALSNTLSVYVVQAFAVNKTEQL